jgi:hypothetical protein
MDQGRLSLNLGGSAKIEVGTILSWYGEHFPKQLFLLKKKSLDFFRGRLSPPWSRCSKEGIDAPANDVA